MRKNISSILFFLLRSIKTRIRKDKLKARHRHKYKKKHLRTRKDKINISFLLESLYPYPLLRGSKTKVGEINYKLASQVPYNNYLLLFDIKIFKQTPVKWLQKNRVTWLLLQT